MYLVLGTRDRFGILPVYHQSVLPAELTEVISDLVLRISNILGDFNIHTKAALLGQAEDFMAAMTTMALSSHVESEVHHGPVLD